MIILSILVFLIKNACASAMLSVFFVKKKIFNGMSMPHVMCISVGISPLFLSLIDYLLGLFFVGWNSWFYYLFTVILSVLYLVYKKNYLILLSCLQSFFTRFNTFLKRIGLWIVLDIFLALVVVGGYSILYNYTEAVIAIPSWLWRVNMMGLIGVCLGAIVLLSLIVFLFVRMKRTGSLIDNLFIISFCCVIGCSCFMGAMMNKRPIIDEDRSHYELEARYFADERNSWEIDNYKDEKYGSSQRDDHGPLWIVALAEPRLVANMLQIEDSTRLSNFSVFLVYLCFVLLLFLVSSYLARTYKAGVLAVLLFDIYRFEIMMIFGSRDAFRFLGLLFLFIYVLNIFEEIRDGIAKWYKYVLLAVACYISINGHESNVYVMLGLFIVMGIMLLVCKSKVKNVIIWAVAVLSGTILGITKTISMYIETGRLASNSGLAFHDTPVADYMKKINMERGEWSVIWSTYKPPVIFVMVLGLVALIVMIVASIVKKDRQTFVASLLILGMLLPMTGIMDWMGYECSRWFLEQYRYRMYFLMLFSITGAWLLTRKWKNRAVNNIVLMVSVCVFVMYLQAEGARYFVYNSNHVEECISTVDNYKILADELDNMTEGNAFTEDQILLYYLHGTPKLLYYIYSEELIQAKTTEEIEEAMENLDVGAILLPESGLDYRPYYLLPFWDYINNSSDFDKIMPGSNGRMDNVDKVIFKYNG